MKKQLTPIERYALALIEYNEHDWRVERLRAADAEIEAQKQEFDVDKLDTLAAEVVTEPPGSTGSTIKNAGSETVIFAGDKSGGSSGEGRNVTASPPAVLRTRSQIDVAIDLWKLEDNSSSRT